MDVSTSSIENNNKKVSLSELSKEELILKCRNLLTIAQKAKQTKDALIEENERLKANTNNNALNEIIENLTEQKLSLVTSLEISKNQQKVLNSKLSQYEDLLGQNESKINELDIENQSYKRQIGRLTDENEQLLTHLSDLENQIEELNKIGLEQQQQLLLLENQSTQAEAHVNHKENEIGELQKMLSVSLEEVKKLKESNNLEESYNKILDENKLYIEKLEWYSAVVDDLKTEIHKNRALNEKLTLDVDIMSKKLSDNQIVSSGMNTDLQNTNEKLKEKLKLYHAKMVKFACDIKSLKESKNYILVNFKNYNDQVQLWKEQLKNATQRLTQEIFDRDTEKKALIEEINDLKKILNAKETDDNSQLLITENKSLKNEINELTKNMNEAISQHENEIKQNHVIIQQSSDQLTEYQAKIKNYEEDIYNLRKFLSDKDQEIEENNCKVIENNKLITELKNAIEHLENEVETSKSIEAKLAEQSGDEIRKLVNENKQLNDKLDELNEKIEKHEENMKEYSDFEEWEEKYNVLKRENTELLTEMNEMNQVLKERGETISKQQSYNEEFLKKISIYEQQTNKNTDIITQNNETIDNLKSLVTSKEVELEQLRNDMLSLQDRLNNSIDNSGGNYQDNDVLSTSTISRAEESSRMKDLEGSWEERYVKLRTLALKLKGRIKELTNELTTEQNEKADLQQKLSANMKTIQTIQTEYDKLQDHLETQRNDNKTFMKKIESLTVDLNKDKDDLVNREETIAKLKCENESLNKDRSGLDSWKKQVGLKVQSLRKELEANGVLKKEFESRIQKLTVDLEAKEKLLKEEREKHLQTKNLLHESNTECKKQSVLSLEIQDYERGIKDMSQKLEKKNEQINKLKGQNDMQKSSLVTLKEENRLFEENKKILETELEACHIEINTFKKNICELEGVISEKEAKQEELINTLEKVRSENEDVNTNLSQIVSEHQKVLLNVKNERDQIRNEHFGLEQSYKDIESQFKQKEDELNSILSEYHAYKVRAQSVLRQNQTRDVGLEEKLSEEAASFRAQVDILKTEVNTLKSTLESTTKENNKFNEINKKIEVNNQELLGQITEYYKEYDKLKQKHQHTLTEHAEAIRSLKLHAETLAQCYRQQISEQEVRHNREIIELQSKLEKGLTPPDIPPLMIPITAREEGEGSESVESSNGNIHPLEKLLGGDQEQEINVIKKQLIDNESKVTHLTALLSDTEQDLAKHVQMNKLLKEEIRRQQRSVEREKHAENLEYMKNVVFKFITLSNGDERQRLIPVLNTILKLSPEETEKLNMVAKGDKSWSNYLPLWSSSSKPQ